jgi:hypothetical protein
MGGRMQTSGSDVKQGDEPWFEMDDKEGSAKGSGSAKCDETLVGMS